MVSLFIIDNYRAKKMDETDIPYLEKLVVINPRANTISSYSRLIGRLLSKNKELQRELVQKYIESNEPSLQKIALIHQINFNKDTDKDLLFDSCLKMSYSRDIEIRHSIGKALRYYSKINPEGVLDFIKENDQKLSHPSKVQALSYLQTNPKASKGLEIPSYKKNLKRLQDYIKKEK